MCVQLFVTSPSRAPKSSSNTWKKRFEISSWQPSLATHVVLPKLDTFRMTLNDLLNKLRDRRLVLESPWVIPFNPSVVRWESPLDGILQKLSSVRAHLGVILDILDEPPCLISLTHLCVVLPSLEVDIGSEGVPRHKGKLTWTISAVVSGVPS
jgi:hypothetical protein